MKASRKALRIAIICIALATLIVTVVAFTFAWWLGALVMASILYTVAAAACEIRKDFQREEKNIP